eukprot:m.101833 g.101833  ORF g.101833 m.101833 type:complete len:778 (+) comp27356_c1_seq1:137-2470(+)
MVSFFSDLLFAVLGLVVVCALDSNTAFATKVDGACRTNETSKFPFCDTSLANEDRIKDLISRLTLEDKLGLINAKHSPVPRLGIPAYDFGNECLHGTDIHVGNLPASIASNGATVFPQPIGMAATFDSDLIKLVGNAISDESRAISNSGGEQSEGNPGFLDCWAPNINIFRDPRWGRGSETYGEDPTLTSKMVTAYVEGLQVGVPAQDTKYVKVMSVLKHFVAYSLEGADGEIRDDFNAIVTKQDLEDTYLPGFKAGTSVAKARGVMCSYNQVNGTPMCSNKELLQGTLRDDWGFEGHVVSDCGAVGNTFFPAGKANTLEDASAMSIKAGTDLNCGSAYESSMQKALEEHKVSEADLDLAISRSMLGRFEVGHFDPSDMNPFTKITYDVVGSDKHMRLAQQVARDSIVLLKNDHEALPLKPSYKNIAVMGPNANDTLVLLGNYHGNAAFNNISTPLMAMQRRLGHKYNITYTPGVDVVTGDGEWGFSAAIRNAREADVVIMFLGSSSKGTVSGVNHFDTVEKESMDRKSLSLPGRQSDLVLAITKQTNASIIVVLINGGPLAIQGLIDNPRVIAIAQAWYAGQQGGEGIVDVLNGDHSPAAKLPVTVYAANYTTQIKSTDMHMRNWPGRTYKYLRVPALFPFGFGLSYSTFEYTEVTAAPQTQGAHGHNVAVTVTNTGDRVADEVVLLFLSFVPLNRNDTDFIGVVPQRELRGFQRLRDVQPLEHRVVNFALSETDFELTDLSAKHVRMKGDWRVEIGVNDNKGNLGSRASTTITIV